MKPLGKRIQISFKKKEGGFVIDNQVVIPEMAEVIAIGDEVSKVKVGDFIYLKGYAVDMATDPDTNEILYFTLEDDNFILAVK